MLFQWTALGTRQFRLLKNRRPLPDGQLSYEVHTASFGAPPRYAVVSYTRSAVNNQPVLVNGRTVMVNKNADAALKQVADLGEYDLIWIDCLCIHESDAEEKARQEKAMAKMYAAADCVYFCQEADASDDANLPGELQTLNTKVKVVSLRSSL